MFFLIYSLAWISLFQSLGVEKQTLGSVLCTPVGLAPVTKRTIYFKIKAEQNIFFSTLHSIKA